MRLEWSAQLLDMPHGFSGGWAYHDFTNLPGSEQIASEFACVGLTAWLRRCCPQHLYEAGGGIGTLSAVVLATSSLPGLRYQMEERDTWCRAAWADNIGPVVGGSVIVMPSWVAPATPFDFVILDGPSGPYWDYLARHSTVFVEGNRRSQRAALESALRGCRRVCRAHWKPSDRSKGHWIYQLDPTPAERLWFVCVRARESLRDLYGRVTGRALGKKRQ